MINSSILEVNLLSKQVTFNLGERDTRPAVGCQVTAVTIHFRSDNDDDSDDDDDDDYDDDDV